MEKTQVPYPIGLSSEKMDALWETPGWEMTDLFPDPPESKLENGLWKDLLAVWNDPDALAQKADFLFQMAQGTIEDTHGRELECLRLRCALYYAFDHALTRLTQGMTENQARAFYGRYFLGDRVYCLTSEWRERIYSIGPEVLGISDKS